MTPRQFLEAARVPHSLDPQEFGLWQIERRKAGETILGELQVDMGLPFGLVGWPDYTLLRRHTLASMHLPLGEVVMEDSLRELRKHLPIWLAARGRILITGLGLGCVVRGLLASPDVERIDVVEIDGDILNAVGPEFAGDPRVVLHHGDALTIELDPALAWDFAWHDIWTHIAERNLNVETAEHGISYDRMFSVWEDRVGEQYAWAYDDALEARDVNERIRQRDIAWYDELESADLDRKVEMLQDRVIGEKHPQLIGHVTPEIRRAFDPNGEFAAHLRDRLIHEPEFMEGLKELSEQSHNGDEPLGRPNEETSV